MPRLPRHVRLEAPKELDPGARLGLLSPRLKGRPPLVIGRGAVIRAGAVLYAGSRIGPGLETGHHAVIREEVVIGREFRIWNHSTVDYGCRVGDRVKVHCGCYVAQYTTLEDDVFLAPGVMIANELYPGLPGSKERMRGPHLEKGVQVGVNATLLPYVRVGAGALVGSGSVVTKDVPAGTVVAGNPAKPRGTVAALKDGWRRRLLGVGPDPER